MNRRKLNRWLTSSAEEEGKAIKEINIIICGDKYLLGLNKEYLNHNYFTDIITFDYYDSVDKEKICGDIFISIDRLLDNACTFGVSNDIEFCRLSIHGILHLCGYNDKNAQEKMLMTNKEDYHLKRLGDVPRGTFLKI